MYVLVRYADGDEERDLDVVGIQGPFDTKAEAATYGRETYATLGPWDVFALEAPKR